LIELREENAELKKKIRLERIEKSVYHNFPQKVNHDNEIITTNNVANSIGSKATLNELSIKSEKKVD